MSSRGGWIRRPLAEPDQYAGAAFYRPRDDTVVSVRFGAATPVVVSTACAPPAEPRRPAAGAGTADEGAGPMRNGAEPETYRVGDDAESGSGEDQGRPRYRGRAPAGTLES